MFRKILILLITLKFYSKFCLSQGTNKYLAQNLTSYLLNEYDKNSKPEGQVIIYMQISLLQIMSVQEKEQSITLSIWVTQQWYDSRLIWNSSDFGNLPFTTIPSDKLWA